MASSLESLRGPVFVTDRYFAGQNVDQYRFKIFFGPSAGL